MRKIFFPYRVVSVKRAARLRSGLSVVKYFHLNQAAEAAEEEEEVMEEAVFTSTDLGVAY